jgi:formiminoglutamate deiminase
VTVDTLLPAPANLHSHTFQRAMAGLTERRRAGQDSFWSWRALMYRFLERLTPDQVEAVAALAFVEMQEAGFAAVAEFHYLHHRPGGAAYDEPAEMSLRIMAAAAETGIGLTHLPVFYRYGGAGRAPLAGGQARFGCDADLYLGLLERVRAAARALPADTVVGVAPHSLRAVAPEDLAALAGQAGPVHIHVAEQTQEVAEILAWLGARPVEWLLDHAPVGPRWCLVHATHMSAAETARAAQSGAVAGLCPVTEANLGDGIFDGPGWRAAGGAFGVGSDSNICISLPGELRMLEYSQRLREGARNVLAEAGSTGAALWHGAARGGAQALGRDCGAIRAGALADLVALDTTEPAFCALRGDQVLDGLVFATAAPCVTDLWSAGRHRVQGGAHVARPQIEARYRAALAGLAEAI